MQTILVDILKSVDSTLRAFGNSVIALHVERIFSGISSQNHDPEAKIYATLG